ncbi:hypothetical protein DSO57_1024345 [Entomophthora muscae]|uniref:Uncharacterized protein n=1 Tax=Entomophthora muscae TaxID=34485 RepID=A0ACC2TDH1_9FUNG|nr:hypothetical protein DSO57_1024345 [Entomophthora muscae]
MFEPALPEKPLGVIPCSTGLLSRIKHAFNGPESNGPFRYTLGGGFFRYFNSSSALLPTGKQSLSQVFRFSTKAICHTYDAGDSFCIHPSNFTGLNTNDYDFVAVDNMVMFDTEYLVIAAYSHITITTKVILFEVAYGRYTILPFNLAGYVSKMSFSLLSDPPVDSTSYTMPTKTYTGSFALAFYLHGAKVSGHIVTVDFSSTSGICYKSDTSFEYTLSSCIKVASFKSWAAPDSKGVIIGFGTTGGSFQLLKYTFSSPAEMPILANAFSAPLSMFSKTASVTSSTPVTWLDFKLLENDICLLMLGQGSIVYSGTTNPCKPSFSLVQLKLDFSHPSLVYSYQADCNDDGAFTAASLIKVDLQYHLAFSYWQGSLTPHVETCHLSIDVANDKLNELHQESFTLAEGDIPLDFHSNGSEFRLLSYAAIKKFSVPEDVVPKKVVVKSKPVTPADFFVNHCSLAGCNDLVLADMPFLSHFLTAKPPRDLVLPPKDCDAAYRLVDFVVNHAASPELHNIILCYCLSYTNVDFASVFAFRFATPNDFKLALGYSMIDRGLIDQGVGHIIQANLDRSAIHFPCELIDWLLQSDQPKQGIRLFNHLVVSCPALVSLDPRGLIKHLDSFGIQRVHQFLRSYQNGPITQEEAYRAFFTKVLADNFQSLSIHFRCP